MQIAKFWARVDIKEDVYCWNWKGCKTKSGYGSVKINGETLAAHRVSFQFLNGPLEITDVVRHACDNPICCNPYHLFAGSHADNVADRVLKDRSAKGQSNGRAKLTEVQVIEILKSNLTTNELAEKFGVTNGAISLIRKRKNWKHLKI